MQTHDEPDPTNDMTTRTTSAISLHPTDNEQGAYYFMYLATGERINRRSWTELPMDDVVIARVEAIALAQDQTLLKFIDAPLARDDAPILMDAADDHVRASDPPDQVLNELAGGANQLYDVEGNILPPPQPVDDYGEDNITMVEDHTDDEPVGPDDEIMDGEDELVEPPPGIDGLIHVPIVDGQEDDTSSSSDDEHIEDDDIPALRVRSEGHGMTLRTHLPTTSSHRDTYAREFQYFQNANLTDNTTPGLEREEQISSMYRVVTGIIGHEANIFNRAFKLRLIWRAKR